jgi:hypothetical protein
MDLAALLAADVADQAGFDIGQPQLVGPAIGMHHGVMAATIVTAMDKDTAHAGFAHFAEGDFLGGHLPVSPIIVGLAEISRFLKLIVDSLCA